MIMRIRVDQPFTLPRTLRVLISKNLDILYPYFNKNIINAERLPLCTLTADSLLRNTKLKALYRQMDYLLDKLPFEAYSITRVDNSEDILRKGLNIPAPTTLASGICKILSGQHVSKENLNLVREHIKNQGKNCSCIPFFMPMNSDYMSYPEYIYFGGQTIMNLFSNHTSEILDKLKHQKTPILIKCIIRYRDFSDNDKAVFMVELIKHITYSIMGDYNYPISFRSTCTRNITPNRILEITRLN